MNQLKVILGLIIIVLSHSACFDDKKEMNCATKDPVETRERNSAVQEPHIFSVKCRMCHLFDKNSTGPALQHVLKRVPSEAWFNNFVRKEDSLTRARDPYTLEIQKWSVVRGNHAFSELTDEQLKDIKEYLSQD